MAKILTEREKLKLPFRGRGLSEFEKEIIPVANLIERSPKLSFRILEIGCGFGQLLLDLRIAFRNKVELYGINLEKDSVDIDRTLRVGKYKNKDVDGLNIDNCGINFIFCDAGEHIPFKNNFFDLIISQAAIVYVNDKSKLLQEINRVLKPDGNAHLWVGFENKGSNLGYWSTLEIYKGDKVIPLSNYFSQFKNIDYKFKYGSSTIHLRKSPKIEMDLELVSFSNLELINPKYYGFKSIYNHL